MKCGCVGVHDVCARVSMFGRFSMHGCNSATKLSCSLVCDCLLNCCLLLHSETSTIPYAISITLHLLNLAETEAEMLVNILVPAANAYYTRCSYPIVLQ